MSLSAIASNLDRMIETPEESETAPATGKAEALELLRYIFSKELLPDASAQIGEALEAGTLAVEAQYGFDPGTVSIEALLFLEGVLDSFRSSLIERMGAAARPDMSPVDFAAHYYLTHGRFPMGADKSVIAGAMRKLASLPKK